MKIKSEDLQKCLAALRLHGGQLHFMERPPEDRKIHHFQGGQHYFLDYGQITILSMFNAEAGKPFFLHERVNAENGRPEYCAVEGENLYAPGPFYSEVGYGGEIVAVWLLLASYDSGLVAEQKLYLEDGVLTVKHAEIFNKEVFRWSSKPSPVEKHQKRLQQIWVEREQYVRVSRVTDYGRGYTGGHNTADRLGWSTWNTDPRKGAILSWDSSTSGSFTGYEPSRTNLVLADSQSAVAK